MSDTLVYKRFISYAKKYRSLPDDLYLESLKKARNSDEDAKKIATKLYLSFQAMQFLPKSIDYEDLMSLTVSKLKSLLKELDEFSEVNELPHGGSVYYTTSNAILTHMMTMQESLEEKSAKVTKSVKSATSKKATVKKSPAETSAKKSVSSSISKKKLEGMTVAELKVIAKEAGLKNYSTKKKDEVIDIIVSHFKAELKSRISKTIAQSSKNPASKTIAKKIANYTPKKTTKSSPKKKVKTPLKSPGKKRTLKGCMKPIGIEMKDYQINVVKYILKDENKGIILAFDTGTGKTVSGCSAIECLLAKNPDWKAIVITPASLETNFKNTLVKFGRDRNDPDYMFFTPESFDNLYNMSRKLQETIKRKGARTSPQKKKDKVIAEKRDELLKIINSGKFVLLIDEAHNYRKNLHPEESFGKDPDTARAISMIKVAKMASKRILLTGTVQINSLSDILNLMAMVRGEDEIHEGTFNSMIENRGKSQSLDYFEKNLYNNQKAIDYFKCFFAFKNVEENDSDYPTLIKHEINIPMSDSYYLKYREQEMKKPVPKKNRTKNGDEPASKMFYGNLRKIMAVHKPNPKVEWVLNSLKQKKKTLIYSAFIDWGIKNVIESLDPKFKFYTISGKIPKNKRQEIVDSFNDPKSGVDTLFITKAGGEGLDLKGVENLIIFDRGWNREHQVIGRARRYKSHTHLPKSRQIVNLYYLDLKKPSREARAKIIAAYNGTRHGGKGINIEQSMAEAFTVDEIMKNLADYKDKKISIFKRWLQSISIDSDVCKGKRVSPVLKKISS